MEISKRNWKITLFCLIFTNHLHLPKTSWDLYKYTILSFIYFPFTWMSAVCNLCICIYRKRKIYHMWTHHHTEFYSPIVGFVANIVGCILSYLLLNYGYDMNLLNQASHITSFLGLIVMLSPLIISSIILISLIVYLIALSVMKFVTYCENLIEVCIDYYYKPKETPNKVVMWLEKIKSKRSSNITYRN